APGVARQGAGQVIGDPVLAVAGVDDNAVDLVNARSGSGREQRGGAAADGDGAGVVGAVVLDDDGVAALGAGDGEGPGRRVQRGGAGRDVAALQRLEAQDGAAGRSGAVSGHELLSSGVGR